MAASGELKIGDSVRVVGDSSLAGKVGTVVSRLVTGTHSLPCLHLVAFVGFCDGHDGYGLRDQVPAVARDGATNRFYLYAQDLELVAPVVAAPAPLKVGDRVRYHGRGMPGLSPELVGLEGLVDREPGPTCVWVSWPIDFVPLRFVFLSNVERIDASEIIQFGEPSIEIICGDIPTSPGDADLIRCADCDCFEIGEIVTYEDQFQQVVAVDGGEVWLRNGAGASVIADVEDVPVSPC